MGYFASHLVILWLCDCCQAGTNMVFSAGQDCKWSHCVMKAFVATPLYVNVLDSLKKIRSTIVRYKHLIPVNADSIIGLFEREQLQKHSKVVLCLVVRYITNNLFFMRKYQCFCV